MNAAPDTRPNLIRRGADWIIRDASLEGFSLRAASLIFWTPLLGWLVFAVLFVVARPQFYLLQQEDHVVEWGQFALCAFTAGAAVIAMRELRFRVPVAALLLVLVAMGSFFLAGEEISWGQRVLGIETPPALAEANQQSETNLHNITLGLDGQTMFKMASAGLGLAGLWGIGAVRLLGRGPDWARLLAPPAVTAPGFAGILVYWVLALVTGNTVAPLLRFQEWVECALYISLAATLAAVVLRVGSPEPGRRRLRWCGVVVLAVTVVFAAATPFSGVTPGNL
jgi:hypothetical protein